MKQGLDVLVFSVRLESGDFESSVRVPLIGGPDATRAAVERWLDLISSGLRTGATLMTADMPVETQ